MVLCSAAGCRTLPRLQCPQAHQTISESLYFGLGRENGNRVSQQQWEKFLAQIVTPRFPQGLTVWEATGQWRGAGGIILREPTRVLNIVHGADPATETAVQAIVRAYRQSFGQEAVLRTRGAVCADLMGAEAQPGTE